MSELAAIVLAAGSSQRMGGLDKLWHPLAGRPVVAHAIDAFEASAEIGTIVLVASPDRMSDARALVDREAWAKVSTIVPGGARRQDSVRAGLAEIRHHDAVMIHDGARPLVTPPLIAEAAHALTICGAAIPVIPATDTIKEVARGVVVRTCDRSKLVLVQTPQVFSRALIFRAYAAPTADADASDDALLVERLGERIATFPGSPSNLKITTPADLELAEAWMAARRARS